MQPISYLAGASRTSCSHPPGVRPKRTIGFGSIVGAVRPNPRHHSVTCIPKSKIPPPPCSVSFLVASLLLQGSFRLHHSMPPSLLSIPNSSRWLNRKRSVNKPPSSLLPRRISQAPPSWKPSVVFCPTSIPKDIQLLAIMVATKTLIVSNGCVKSGRFKPFVWIRTNGASMYNRSVVVRPIFK